MRSFSAFKNRMRSTTGSDCSTRQGDQFIPQAIKETFPYLLGAVDEQHFLRQAELNTARDALKHLEQRASQRRRASSSVVPTMGVAPTRILMLSGSRPKPTARRRMSSRNARLS